MDHQSWVEWVSHLGEGADDGYSVASYTSQNRNHYLSHQNTECSWPEGQSDQRVDCSSPEEVRLPCRQRRAVFPKGDHSRSVRHCPGRVSMLQTPRRTCSVKGLLWRASVHCGEWSQGLWDCGVWKALKTESQVHEVCGRSDDPQWRPC